ncbi:MAG TPA: ImcF-related family protein [Terracidiphilus sp.]|nr:ImcF-related family protein [Terracidiphilus sp.]
MLPILLSIFVLILSIVLAWLVGPLLGIAGTALLILRILLVLMGAAVAGVILYFYFRDKQRDAATMRMPGGADLDALLRDAEKRLATAQRAGAKSLETLPLLYVLGEFNSAKTTAILKSGFDPELLAGQVYRDQDIVATPVANFWYTQASVFVEPGDAVRKAPALWSRLIRKTRPRAIRSAMGKQAPVRAAVVCVSSELFLGPSAPEASLASARATNQMLRELSQQLGTEVPVYVILTKMDRLPYFSEYVRNLSNDEASQPLGMAFGRIEASSGLYAEKAMGEVTSALDKILFSLGEFRLELLGRENDAANVDPVYEFPRELRKLRNHLAGYLVELARPSHLNANPYLRGFYATGVRAHLVQEAVAAAAQSPKAEPAGAGATRMFTVEQMRSAAAAQAPQVVSRKQAQWCFLPRLFPSVIFEDRTALSGTSNSKRTHLLRRTVFATLSVLLFAFLMCLTVSWVNNSRLEHAVISAANALPETTQPSNVLVSTQNLSALEELRSAVARLEGYQRNGPPLMYRFGLYHGDSVLEASRRLYFDRFRHLLLANTQTNLVSALNALPGTPPAGADYSAAYNPLKAYLITTSNPDKSTPDFLAPVLVQYWENGQVPQSDEQKQLAAQQFEFYAAELAQNNPFSIAPDTGAVSHARTYLAGFGGFERIYQQMITAANKTAPSIDFNRLYAGSSGTVIEPHVVNGAFTRNGYTFMQDAIQHPDRYFSGEVWVLGDQAPPSLDRATLTQQLTTRYVGDYQTEWRTFLHSAEVVKYRNLADAGTKLQTLSNPSSTLLELLFTASHNTAVANQDIAKEFQPAQAIVLPDSVDKFVGPGNTNYLNGLLALQAAVAQVAQDPAAAGNPAAMTPIVTAATSAHTAASQTAQVFNLDPQGHVDQMVLTLMQEPITWVDDVVRGVGPQQANGGGASFCRAFSGVMAKFPFSSTSTIEASPTEVAALLQPGSGSMWQLYDSTLKTLLVQQGSTYVANPSAPMKVNPEFVQFFNRAAGLSAALYPAAGSNGLNFTVHVLPSNGIQNVTLALDTQRLNGIDVSRQFTWSIASSQQAQLSANSLPLFQFSGPWAVFHIMAQGRVEESGATERLAIPLEANNKPIVSNGSPVMVRFDLSGPNANLLMPGALGMRCVSTVVH